MSTRVTCHIMTDISDILADIALFADYTFKFSLTFFQLKTTTHLLKTMELNGLCYMKYWLIEYAISNTQHFMINNCIHYAFTHNTQDLRLFFPSNNPYHNLYSHIPLTWCRLILFLLTLLFHYHHINHSQVNNCNYVTTAFDATSQTCSLTFPNSASVWLSGIDLLISDAQQKVTPFKSIDFQ